MEVNKNSLTIIQYLERIYNLDDKTKAKIYKKLNDLSKDDIFKILSSIEKYEKKQEGDLKRVFSDITILENQLKELEEKKEFVKDFEKEFFS